MGVTGCAPAPIPTIHIGTDLQIGPVPAGVIQKAGGAKQMVYILCKDPRTGKQLVTQGDFLKHGAAVFAISFAVLWGWAFLGYWRWLGF